MASYRTIVTPGELRRRVTIEQRVTTPDGSGGVATTWNTLATVWAKVSPKGGGERLHADQRTPTLLYDVIIRYRNDVDASMRIGYEGRSLRINSVIDADAKHKYLTLDCDEWPAQAN